MLSNPSDIEDVYQQACLARWQRRAHFHDVHNFFAFACGFARNEALHLIRRNARKGCVHLSEEMLATIAAEARVRQPEDRCGSAIDRAILRPLHRISPRNGSYIRSESRISFRGNPEAKLSRVNVHPVPNRR
jgi:DNA-directed RNA polymerase specialized sigma24 family protein